MTTKNAHQSTYKIGKKYLFISLALIFILGISFTYIYENKYNEVDNSTVQISKFDFTDSPTPQNIDKVLYTLRNTEGIKSTNYFDESNALIAVFDNKILDNSNIEVLVNSISDIPINAFKVSKEEMASGCPIQKAKSMFGWLNKIKLI